MKKNPLPSKRTKSILCEKSFFVDDPLQSGEAGGHSVCLTNLLLAWCGHVATDFGCQEEVPSQILFLGPTIYFESIIINKKWFSCSFPRNTRFSGSDGSWYEVGSQAEYQILNLIHKHWGLIGMSRVKCPSCLGKCIFQSFCFFQIFQPKRLLLLSFFLSYQHSSLVFSNV